MALKAPSTDAEMELSWRRELLRRLANVESARLGQATEDTSGPIRLAGDLAGTPDYPLVPGLLLKADDVGVAHNHGDETWTGIKNFYVSPLVPSPTAAGQAANKAYVDSVGGGGGGAVTSVAGRTGAVTLTTADIISGVFSNARIPDATTGAKGQIQLAGDLAGTATAPTAPGKANDSAVIHNTGAESVAGVKGFAASPTGPTPTTATQMAIKSYVDGLDALAAHLAGAETFTGAKAFNVNVDVPLTPTATTHATSKSYVDGLVAAGAPDASTTAKGILKLAGDLAGTALLPTVVGLAGKAVDTAVLHNTGAETAAGVKTFSSSPIVPTPTGTTDAANKTYVDGKLVAGWKTADTSRASNSTLSNDPDLAVSVVAGATYEVDITLLFSSDITPAFKNAMAIPTGATSTLANYSSTNGYRLSGTTVDTWTVANTTVRAIRYSGTLICPNAGTYAVQWAQNTSNATAAVVRAGSIMVLERVA